MANEKMAILVKKLLEKTRAGSLEWKEDTFEDAFVARVAKTSVYVKNNEGKQILQLKNYGGTVIEEMANTDGDISYETSDNIKTLYEIAKRSALGTDKLIDDILTELDDEIPF